MSAPYQVMPPLSADEYEALKESIATFGVLQPVVTDQDGRIVDGHHRVRACAELGITTYPRIMLPGLTETQKIEQALALNLARRHLTPDQKRQLVADLRARGISVRGIAAATGIPRSTVARHAASGVPSGTPEYVTGEDGKRYRAARSDDEVEAWRAAVEEVTGPGFCATPDELRAQMTAGTFGLAASLPEDFDWEDFWFRHYLPQAGAQYAWRNGAQPRRVPPPPLKLLISAPRPLHPSQRGRPRPTLTEAANRTIALSLMIERQMGEFIVWAESHGLASSKGPWRLKTPDPSRFASCDCEFCKPCRDAGFSALGLAQAARGHVYCETGVILPALEDG